MSAPKLRPELRNYVISHKIPVSTIDFEESIIEAGTNYQVLVLKRPNEFAVEIEPMKWTYPPSKALLVFNCSSDEVSIIPLSFSRLSVDPENYVHIDFSAYHSLAICEDHILLVTTGKEPHGNNQCAYLALLTTAGKLVSVWKMENACGYKTRIKSFSQLQPGHWVVKLGIDEEKQHQPEIESLRLLSLGRPETYDLSLGSAFLPRTGSLLASFPAEITNWFGEEVDGKAHLFVLAGHYQFCIYRRPADKKERYQKIADVTVEHAFIRAINVTVANEGITVGFDNQNALVKFGTFHVSF